MKKMISILLVGVLSGGFAVPSAIAQPANQEAQALASAAKDQFKAKNFEAAAKLFMQAYARSHTPSLVFNAARAYEEAGKNGDAVGLFKLYITLTDDADGIMEARQHIAKLEAIRVPVVVEVPVPVIVTAPKPVAVAPKPVVVNKVSKVAIKPTGPNRTAEWVTTGLGVAALGVGTVMMLDGASDTKRYSGTNRNAYDSARTEWQVGLGMAVSGAVLGGVSAYLWAKTPVTVAPLKNGVTVGVNF
jgi:hypothetical protein